MKSTILAIAVLAAGIVPAIAAPPTLDPNWPCQQVKVPQLSVGTMWTGPAIDPYLGTWQQVPHVADLVLELSQRRVSIAQAQTKIADFAKQAGADRQKDLLALFAGLFQTLDDERASVVAGLDRFGARQVQLASELHGDEQELQAAQSATPPNDTKVSALTDKLTWNAKVYEQRRASISYACDVPNVIDQRLYALAQAIQPLLDQNANASQ